MLLQFEIIVWHDVVTKHHQTKSKPMLRNEKKAIIKELLQVKQKHSIPL
jgi:hypothetical protein